MHERKTLARLAIGAKHAHTKHTALFHMEHGPFLLPGHTLFSDSLRSKWSAGPRISPPRLLHGTFARFGGLSSSRTRMKKLRDLLPKRLRDKYAPKKC